MSTRDTAGGMTAASMLPAGTAPRRRRPTAFKRVTWAVRDHAGIGVFMAMLIACITLVALSR